MTTTEIIDQVAYDRFFDSIGSDVDFLSELFDSYFTSSPELIADMRQAIASGEAPRLQRAAHSLKSGSANFGALAFAAQCRELEDIGKTGDLSGAEEKVEALEAAYSGVEAALQARLQSARSAPA
jgi:HPt (histidine-containing phosphotransfer) domain-containing protein